MKVDVLVLTHNRLDVTRRFVEALYNNTPEFYLHVLDNGSTDGTPAYLKQLFGEKRNVRVCLNPTNLGVIEGRNMVYAHCWNASVARMQDDPRMLWRDNLDLDANHLIFLDNDQIVHDGWVDSYQHVFDHGYDIVGWEAWLQYAAGPRKFMPMRRCQHTTPFFNYVGCGGMMMRWEVMDDLGAFDPVFSPAYFEDPDFCYHALDEGYKIGWNPTDLIFHEAHSTLGRSDWKKAFAASYLKFREKWGSRPVPEIKHEALH